MTRMLVVDDSSVIRKVARRIFEGLSLQTAEAENGLAALELCAADMPGRNSARLEYAGDGRLRVSQGTAKVRRRP